MIGKYESLCDLNYRRRRGRRGRGSHLVLISVLTLLNLLFDARALKLDQRAAAELNCKIVYVFGLGGGGSRIPVKDGISTLIDYVRCHSSTHIDSIHTCTWSKQK